MDNFDLDKGGVKFDAGKIRMDLVPQDAIMAIAAVFTYGAIKYDDWNWAKGMRDGRIDAAYERHRAAYLLGEEVDEESGLPHLWHMGCCVLMRISGQLRGVLEDDRQKSAGALCDIMYRFTQEMKDPAGTVKNGGGAIKEHWAEDITDSPEDWEVLDDLIQNGDRVSGQWTAEELRQMREEQAHVQWLKYNTLPAFLTQDTLDSEGEDTSFEAEEAESFKAQVRAALHVNDGSDPTSQ